MDFSPIRDPAHDAALRLAGFVVEAMAAGLAGARLPNFGAPFTPAAMAAINDVYDNARNRHAAAQVRARR